MSKYELKTAEERLEHVLEHVANVDKIILQIQESYFDGKMNATQLMVDISTLMAANDMSRIAVQDGVKCRFIDRQVVK